jgi:hypothetical protein
MEHFMFRKFMLATAATTLLGAAAYAGETTNPDRKVLIDRTITQTIPAKEAGAPKVCDGQAYLSAECGNAKVKPASQYPVNALEGLNLGF